MKVRDLVAQLQGLDPDLEVYMDGASYGVFRRAEKAAIRDIVSDAWGDLWTAPMPSGPDSRRVAVVEGG